MEKEKRILSTLIEERFMVSGIEFDTFIKMCVSFTVLFAVTLLFSFVTTGTVSLGFIVLWLIVCYFIKSGLTEYRRNLPTYLFIYRSISRMFVSKKEEVIYWKGVSDGKKKSKE